jgi:uronate dehydrogenase
MKVVITGALGTIGTVLRRGLPKEWQIVGLDLESAEGVTKCDILKDAEILEASFAGADAIVHLAWDMREIGAKQGPFIPENREMARRVLETADKCGVKRILFASSVHVMFGEVGYIYPGLVREHQTLHRARKITETDPVSPISAYAESKVFIEQLGKAYSAKGMTIIAARFGHVTKDDSHGEYPFWFSHRDCVEFVRRALTTELPPFSVFIATSNNSCSPFSLRAMNSVLGLVLQDGAPCPSASTI